MLYVLCSTRYEDSTFIMRSHLSVAHLFSENQLLHTAVTEDLTCDRQPVNTLCGITVRSQHAKIHVLLK